MSDSASSEPSSRPGLLGPGGGAPGKEVYEYTPDPGSIVSHARSAEEAFERDSFRSSHATRDVDDSSVSPNAAYEFFRGKTYKSTVFQNGFSARRGLRGPHYSALEARGHQHQSLLFASRSSDMGSAGSLEYSQSFSFETPIGRLHRLRGEVEEMLEFVSSFLVEERVAPAAVSARQAAATEQPEQHQQQQEQQQQQQETEEAEAAEEDQAKTLQVQYQARRLSPAAQDALLSGHDPIVLIDELKRLRMQVVSVLNDKRTEALVPLVEPVTGKPSGASLLTEHLSAVSAQLQQALQQQGEGGTISVSSGTPTAGSGPTSAWSKGFREADTLSAGGDSRGGGPAHAQMNYEVYCIPSVGRVIEQGRVTALERRLALVENKMGLHKMSLLPHPDLFEAVTHMQQRVKLLDPQKIEALQKRVQSLLLELHALQQRRHELDVAAEAPSSAIAGGAAKAVGGTPSGGHRVVGGPPHSGGSAAASDWQRVEELYELCERWKAPAAVLPSVLERLKLLKGIHQEAGGVSVRLSVLEKQQEELQAWVRKADAAVSQLQRTVLESIQWAQATVEQMQQRLRAVAGAPPPPPPLAPAAAAAADA